MFYFYDGCVKLILMGDSVVRGMAPVGFYGAECYPGANWDKRLSIITHLPKWMDGFITITDTKVVKFVVNTGQN